MPMQRAYSLLEIKAVNDDERVITGIATTPTPDSYDDIVEPKGAVFKLPIPLLWQHDSSQPIGHVTAAKVTDAGIEITAKLAAVADAGTLKDRLDEAWQSIKAGLVAGLSIGFKPIESANIEGSWGRRFLSWQWLELSAVTIPANADASIQSIKSIDTKQRAASGHALRTVVRLDSPPGDSGTNQAKPAKSGFFFDPTKGKDMTIAEQIASFEAKRAASAERMNAVMTKAADEGRTLDEAETEEYDGLTAEVKAVDEHLVRLKSLEKANVAKAVPVNQAATTEAASQSRGGNIVTIKSNLPKGTGFARYAMALARSKGNLMQAAEIAKGWHDSTPEVETVLRAAVAAGTTTDTSWAKPLVEYQNLTGEFIELLRPATIIGKIQGLRRVPFNIKMPSQTSGASVGWVGEGAPKPVSKLGFGTTTLGFAKVAGIVVMTDELVRFSNPSAEAIVNADLVATVAQFLDKDFVDPDKAVSADVSPASITNGLTPVTASGTDADALKADVKAVFGKFIAANLSVAGSVWIMTSTQALAIGLMQNALGQPEFPGIGMDGGTFFGLPVIVSENIPAYAGTGSPPTGAGSRIILAKPSEILLADDGGVTLDVSREASLQMSDAPSAGAAQLTSLWQNNLVAIRAEREVNWAKRRAEAVAYINGANYG